MATLLQRYRCFSQQQRREEDEPHFYDLAYDDDDGTEIMTMMEEDVLGSKRPNRCLLSPRSSEDRQRALAIIRARQQMEYRQQAEQSSVRYNQNHKYYYPEEDGNIRDSINNNRLVAKVRSVSTNEEEKREHPRNNFWPDDYSDDKSTLSYSHLVLMNANTGEDSSLSSLTPDAPTGKTNRSNSKQQQKKMKIPVLGGEETITDLSFEEFLYDWGETVDDWQDVMEWGALKNDMVDAVKACTKKVVESQPIRAMLDGEPRNQKRSIASYVKWRRNKA